MKDRIKIGEDILIFIDETGQEELEDPRYPVFGLAACVVLSKEYTQNIKEPWATIYSSHFNNGTIPLHASQARTYNAEQKEAIGAFFKKQSFARACAVTNNKAEWPNELFRYQSMAALFRECLQKVLRVYNFESVAMVFEACQRTDHLVQKYFSNIQFINKQNNKTSVKGYFIQKRECCRGEAGLEVADFIANAAGGRSNARAKGDERNRTDFECVFGSIDRNMVGFMELSGASFKHRPDVLPKNLKDWTLNFEGMFA